MSSRLERRVIAKMMREQAKAWPDKLEPIAESEWPPRRDASLEEYPIAVWRSRHYLATLYRAPPLGRVECVRLSVNRVTRSVDGDWDENIPWEDLMRCKREMGFGDCYAVEIYPRDVDIVNVANMRHLWMLEEPLRLGWFAGLGG